MICNFDICEFWNLLFGGIVVGVLASFMFVWITDFIRIRRFQKRYKHLQSKTEYDWIAYSMKDENGRLKQEESNGSSLNIEIRKDRIFLRVKQIDNRVSIGELMINGFDYGIVTFKYENEHEYGRRECVIGSYMENGKKFDYLFTIPLNDKIYYIDASNPKNHKVHYNYGNELFIRDSKAPLKK